MTKVIIEGYLEVDAEGIFVQYVMNMIIIYYLLLLQDES